MASTETNMNSVDKLNGDDITATERNNIRKDLRLGIRDNRLNDDGATITLDMSITNNHQVPLGGNRTIAFANVTRGQHFKVKIDYAGAYTPTWPSGISWVGSVAPTPTSVNGKRDTFAFECTDDSPSFTYDGYIAGLNIG